MHDSDQQADLEHPRSLILQFERSLDHVEALQSLELQHLRLLIQRRQLKRQTAGSGLSFAAAINANRKADAVIRRAA